ncbi:hypothetical protein BG004_004557 [Podila humilis]|nr:hypothetical protein BG004_004557 [Podila humilis]
MAATVEKLVEKLTSEFAKLREHPLVADSPRDLRIVKELGRYIYTLKKMHYRNLAQQKLSRKLHSDRGTQRRQRHEDRDMTPTQIRPPMAWSVVTESGADARTRPSSSNRSSSVSYGMLIRKSAVSDATTEELPVEFRSSDQSDDYDSDDDHSEFDDSTDDGFEPSSENSQYEDDDYYSQYTVSGHEDEDEDEQDKEEEDEEEVYSSEDGEEIENGTNAKRQHQIYSPDSTSYPVAPYVNDPSECHLPSPAFSPRSEKSPMSVSGSFRSHPFISNSVVSSTASRAQAKGARPAIPNFHDTDAAAPIQTLPDNFHQSYRHSMTGRRTSHTMTYPRPLSVGYPPSTSGLPSLCGPHISSTHGSMRSIEPYMNPPPRSIASIEKKKTWSKYMSATVGRLSKMKRVFSSKKGSGHRHTHSSTSTHSLGSGGKGGNSSGVSQRALVRHWHGNQSDPEGGKISHYFLGSCSGMNMLVSSSDDRRLSLDRKSTATREHNGASGGGDAGGGGSSDEEFSQYEMTRHSSHLMLSQNEYQQDAVPLVQQQQIYLEGQPDDLRCQPYAANEHGQTPAQHRHDQQQQQAHGETDKDVCSECEREQYFSSPSNLQQGPPSINDHNGAPEVEHGNPREELEAREDDGDGEDGDGDGGEYAEEQQEDAEESAMAQISMGTKRIPNLRRTSTKKDRNHRASWMTFSSTNSTVFGAILSEDHLSPRQVMRDRNRHGNVDRFVERLYKAQQQQQQPVTRFTVAPPSSAAATQRRRSVDMMTTMTPSVTSATPSRRRASWMLLNSNSWSDMSGASLSESNRLNVNSTKRQTTPLVYLHHHYHHHLADDKPARRHSSDVQNMEGWQGFRASLHQKTAAVIGNNNNNSSSQEGTPTINTLGASAVTGNLALVSTLSPLSKGSEAPHGSIIAKGVGHLNEEPQQVTVTAAAAISAMVAPVVPFVEPHVETTMTMRQEQQRRTLSTSSSHFQQQQQQQQPTRGIHAHTHSQPLAGIIPRSNMSQKRSSSQPHLLSMSDPEFPVSTIAAAATTLQHHHPLQCRHQRSRPIPNMSGIGQQQQQSLQRPGMGSATTSFNNSRPTSTYGPQQQQQQQQQHHQQPAAMDMQFVTSQRRGIMATTATRVPVTMIMKSPPPLVLRYRSELIAQQLCLIEREMLNQIQWYELVDAGTRNKAAAAAKTEAAAAEKKASTTVSESGVEVQDNVDGTIRNGVGDGPVGQTANRSEGTLTPTPTPTTPTPTPAHMPAPVSSVAGAMTGTGGGEARPSRGGSQTLQKVSKVEEKDGIKRLVDRFNITCQWVSSDILKTGDLDIRVKVVEKFIRIAKTCYNHSNFSSLMQIMLALQSTPVSRLYRTWSRVRAQELEIFADLVEFTSPFHNWRHLRETMKNIADDWGGAVSGDGGVGGSASAGGSPQATSPTTEKPSSGLSFFNRRKHTANGSPSSRGQQDLAQSQQQQASGFAAAGPLGIGHRKISSSPMLPSMVSSMGKGKEKEVNGGGGGGEQKNVAQQRQQQQQQQGGCIPFLGLYLSDLVFNTEIPSFVEPRGESTAASMVVDGVRRGMLVNIHKHRRTATIIKRILTFRMISARYPFHEEREVHCQLAAVRGMDPAELQRMSLQLEERMEANK